jgi:hypothetical protein
MGDSSRFVILHHVGYGCEHWDLMLEHGDALLTWQLLSEPLQPSCGEIQAVRIGNHRKAYLEYEGEVSGGRGKVVRIDGGTVVVEELTDRCCRFRAAGSRLSGRYELAAHRHGWSMRPRTDTEASP